MICMVYISGCFKMVFKKNSHITHDTHEEDEWVNFGLISPVVEPTVLLISWKAMEYATKHMGVANLWLLNPWELYVLNHEDLGNSKLNPPSWFQVKIKKIAPTFWGCLVNQCLIDDSGLTMLGKRIHVVKLLCPINWWSSVWLIVGFTRLTIVNGKKHGYQRCRQPHRLGQKLTQP